MSGWDAAERLARTMGHLVVRDKQWRPTALAAKALNEWFRFDAERQLPNPRMSVQTQAARPVDFTVDLAAPIIGGLTLLAPLADAWWYATEGVARVSSTLECVDALLDMGDVFVDHGAGIGVVTLCAAMRVGTTGRVISVEPDAATRALLERNLARHGVTDRVSTQHTLDVAVLEPLVYDGWILWGIEHDSPVPMVRRLDTDLRDLANASAETGVGLLIATRPGRELHWQQSRG
jgi:hypothetical protein